MYDVEQLTLEYFNLSPPNKCKNCLKITKSNPFVLSHAFDPKLSAVVSSNRVQRRPVARDPSSIFGHLKVPAGSASNCRAP